MSKYDDLFAETASGDSVFAEKRALDPLTPPDEIRGRETQERQLATIFNGVHERYLPPTVAIHGPPGTGKTATTRRVCREFADRTADLAVEYVNLKECRSIFSAANEIHLELTGEKVGAWLDGAFTGIWETLVDYPPWTVLVLDEIDHITQDSNYDPSEFLYRLLRGEGKLAREIQLSAWLISNELLEVDLRLDSRVESAMSDETVFFPPYGASDLDDVIRPTLERAFVDGAIPENVLSYGISKAAIRWGDARKALTLFRRAGETANERGLDAVTEDCIEVNLEGTEKEATIEKLAGLPGQHFSVLVGITARTNTGSAPRRNSRSIRRPPTLAARSSPVREDPIIGGLRGDDSVSRRRNHPSSGLSSPSRRRRPCRDTGDCRGSDHQQHSSRRTPLCSR